MARNRFAEVLDSLNLQKIHVDNIAKKIEMDRLKPLNDGYTTKNDDMVDRTARIANTTINNPNMQYDPTDLKNVVNPNQGTASLQYENIPGGEVLPAYLMGKTKDVSLVESEGSHLNDASANGTEGGNGENHTSTGIETSSQQQTTKLPSPAMWEGGNGEWCGINYLPPPNAKVNVSTGPDGKKSATGYIPDGSYADRKPILRSGESAIKGFGNNFIKCGISENIYMKAQATKGEKDLSVAPLANTEEGGSDESQVKINDFDCTTSLELNANDGFLKIVVTGEDSKTSSMEIRGPSVTISTTTMIINAEETITLTAAGSSTIVMNSDAISMKASQINQNDEGGGGESPGESPIEVPDVDDATGLDSLENAAGGLGDIASGLGDMTKGLVSQAANISGILPGALPGLDAGFGNLTGGLGDMAKGLGDLAGGLGNIAVGDITKQITNITGDIGKQIGKMTDNLKSTIGNSISNVAGNLAQNVTQGITNVTGQIGNITQQAGQQIGNMAKQAGSLMQSSVGALTNVGQQIMNKAPDVLNQLKENIPDVTKMNPNSALDKIMHPTPTFPSHNIPSNATTLKTQNNTLSTEKTNITTQQTALQNRANQVMQMRDVAREQARQQGLDPNHFSTVIRGSELIDENDNNSYVENNYIDNETINKLTDILNINIDDNIKLKINNLLNELKTNNNLVHTNETSDLITLPNNLTQEEFDFIDYYMNVIIYLNGIAILLLDLTNQLIDLKIAVNNMLIANDEYQLRFKYILLLLEDIQNNTNNLTIKQLENNIEQLKIKTLLSTEEIKSVYNDNETYQIEFYQLLKQIIKEIERENNN